MTVFPKKYFGFHRPWRPAWNAGGEGRGICYNATAVQKAADAAARVAQIDPSKTRAKEFDRASKNAKALASFENFFYSDDDTADLKADPFLYSTFSISPVSFHRWRFAIPLHTMNTEIDLITMNANEHGRLFIGEIMPEYIPLHGSRRPQ